MRLVDGHADGKRDGREPGAERVELQRQGIPLSSVQRIELANGSPSLQEAARPSSAN